MTRWGTARVLRLMALAGLLLLTPADRAPAADEHKQILVLYSTRRDSEFSTVSENVLPRALDTGLDRNLDYYSEFIDSARFPDPSYQEAFGDFLRQKYQGTSFDLVIAMHDVAVEFAVKHRERLFAKTPVVFFSNNRATRGGPNSTGVVVERNLAPTVSLIEQLQPDVRQVFVVTGDAPADKEFEQLARRQLRSFDPRLTITYLSGLTTPDLERQVARLPQRSAIYYLLVTQDGAGNKFHPLQYVDRVAKAANAPTYCWVDSAMGHGIVGGSLYGQEAAVDSVAKLALRVLRGEPADSIPPSVLDLNVNQVDWRRLRDWSISESRVPAETLVRFKEPGIWDRYRVYIVGAGAALVGQTMLIAGLLVQRRRRWRAEEELRKRQAELRTSYEQIRDLGSRLLEAQENERARIARELHDDVSQQMALLTIDLTLLNRGMATTDRDKLAGEALDRAHDIARSVHDLSHRLHPAKLRLIGLISALQGLLQELSRPGIAIAFTYQDVPAVLPPDLMLCLFRIVQEALQNAIKHSGSEQLSVHLAGNPEGLTLTVADDGVGFDVKSAWGKGLGLISLGERVETAGGTFEILSTPGAGTRVEVRVPFQPPPGAETVAV
jgi:signal transduction histidine kinase